GRDCVPAGLQTSPQVSHRRRNHEAPSTARQRRTSGLPGSRDAGDSLCFGTSSERTGRAQGSTTEPSPWSPFVRGKGEQGTRRACRAGSGAPCAGVSEKQQAGAAEEKVERLPVRHPKGLVDDPAGVLEDHRRLRTKGGHSEKAHASCCPAFLCYPSAGERGRPTFLADDVGTRGYFHDADLHSCDPRASKTNLQKVPSPRLGHRESLGLSDPPERRNLLSDI